MGSRARVALIILVSLCGHEAARIHKNSSVRQIVARSLGSTGVAVASDSTKSLGVARGLTEEGCKFDKEPGDDVNENSEGNSTAIVTTSLAMDPDEYWSAENALDRCRAAGKMRMTKVFVSAPIVILSGAVAATFLVESQMYMGALQAVADVTYQPLMSAMMEAGGTVLTPLLQYAWSVPLVSVAATLTAVFGALASVFSVGGFIIAALPVSVMFLTPVIAAMDGAQKITALNHDIGSRLLGYGPKAPSCCCAEVEDKAKSSATCAVVATSEEAKWQVCPPGWVHDATECPMPEIIQYSEKTVEGCKCMNGTDCGQNKPHKGHAWCDVAEPANCGWRWWRDSSKRWDFCRVDGQPLRFAEGESTAPNDALATFIPNQFDKHLLLPGPSSSFALGTWVDAHKGLTTGKPGFFEHRQCFVGLPVETLSACARLCLEDGAPTAKTMSEEAEVTHPCVAFAYHRALHLCVRLPEFANDAEFTPHLSEWTGDGWMNFVSKYHGRDADAVCPSKTLMDIRDTGFSIVRDMNNGHVYVQCANSDNIQMVSCLEDECDHRSSWCFVQNNCSSTRWNLKATFRFGKCWRLSDEAALKCHSKFGAVVPDDNLLSEYWDAENVLGRCWDAQVSRMVKVAIAVPLLLAVGEFATVSYLQNQLVAGQAFVDSVSNMAWTVGDKVLMVGSAVASAAVPLTTVVWGAVAAAFAAIFQVGSFIFAVGGPFAALLAPAMAHYFCKGFQKLEEVGINVLSRLVGFGPDYPVCCCPDDEAMFSSDGLTRACAVVASMSADTPKCPKDWSHLPSQCAIPEVIRYSKEQTVGGCQCRDFTQCNTNQPYHGHAWCYVKGPNRCGRGNRLSGRWDFCRLDGKPVAYAAGLSTKPSDAMAIFIPNEFTRLDVFGPSNPLKLGTWTDPDHALTTAKKSFWGKRECFAAIPVETLGGCAQLCLNEGAPNATLIGMPEKNTSYPCVGFAFNRYLSLCVRLPAFAADAKYTPMMRFWGGEGWQNYVSKFYGRNLESSCPAMTLLSIRDEGYAVARDKNNGRLYLRCADGHSNRTQKASCRQDDCGESPWCFVQNQCGGMFKGCHKIPDQNPLTCEEGDPCVTAEQRQCVFPFKHDGVTYNGCTTVEHEQPWCYTQVDSNGEGYRRHWGNCVDACPKAQESEVQPTKSDAGTDGKTCTTRGGQCFFPFKHEGIIYRDGNCTTVDNDAPWCYTEVDINGDGVSRQWGECAESCSKAEESVPEESEAPEDSAPEGSAIDVDQVEKNEETVVEDTSNEEDDSTEAGQP